MKMVMMFVYVTLGFVLYMNAVGGLEQCHPHARPADLTKVEVQRCPGDTICERRYDDLDLIIYWKLDLPCDRDVNKYGLTCKLRVNTPTNDTEAKCEIYFHGQDDPRKPATELRFHADLRRNEHIFIECHCHVYDEDFVEGEVGYYEQHLLFDSEDSTDGMCVRGRIKMTENYYGK